MSARWDLLGFGAVAVDDLLYVEHYPPPDSKMPVQRWERQGGGLTGTALVAAARLGAKAAYAGILGDDDLSLYTLHELEKEGVDCGPVLRRRGARPFHSIVIVDLSTAQRSILYTAEGVQERQPEEMTEDLIARCRVLFVDHIGVAGGLRAVELAHRHGIPVVADFERAGHPLLPALMRQVDHLILGLRFASLITGESEPPAIVRALASPERACCVVTAGERGCWYAERGGEVRHFPAFRVSVVDTTGCGDVFHGAYAASLARGEGVDTAIRVATAAAALKATQAGGRAGIPSRATVDRFLQEHAGAERLGAERPIP
jgi:sugar/nucleoside kinase (ribokinase family)